MNKLIIQLSAVLLFLTYGSMLNEQEIKLEYTENGVDYSISIGLLPEDTANLWDEHRKSPPKEGRFYLSYGIATKQVVDNVTDEVFAGYYILVTPDKKGRYKLEIFLTSKTFYRDGVEFGHAEPSGKWVSAGYSDEDSIPAKVFRYYSEKSKI